MQLVKLHYSLPEPLSCKYYVFGLHDNYLIENSNDKFIFRIYRNDWRTKEEIFFEIALLSYLDKKSANVAVPLTTKNAQLSTSIDSPEGERIAVLFSYAQGHAPENDISLEECTLLGRSVAKLHEETRHFKTHYTRPILNLEYLVDRSLALIKPFLTANQYAYLKNIQSRVQTNISLLNDRNGDFGICVGDINPTNFHISEKKVITHFDFDQCGFGYRSFEIGKFSSCLQLHETKKDKVLAFIQGYENVRQLTGIEKMTIPYFEIASMIWVMSIYVSNANKIGHKYLDNSFWYNRLGSIEALDANLV